MSIYFTRFVIDPRDEDSSPGIVLARDHSNTHPDPAVMRHGSVDGAQVPAWCVPGHGHKHDASGPCFGHDHPAAWYRLGASALHEGDLPFKEVEVLLDEDAVRSLRDDLTRWLDLPKTLPSEVG